jgi:hypothetical protein
MTTICLPVASAERLMAANIFSWLHHQENEAAGEYSNVVNAASEIHNPIVQMRQTVRNVPFSSILLILSPLQSLEPRPFYSSKSLSTITALFLPAHQPNGWNFNYRLVFPFCVKPSKSTRAQ